MFPEEQSKRLGYDGYDVDHTEEMNGIFMAFGPSIREGYEIDTIEQVDVYNLMCHLIGIKPKNNDGKHRFDG